MSGMPHLSAIHFLLTYRCTYECDHCFVWGSPEQEGTMTLAQVRHVIDEAIELGTVDTVYFEGGEPTLVYPVMIKAAEYARARGLAFGVVSNCHFAESVEDAALWLEPLARLGVADLSLSSYIYFTEDHDERLLRNAVQAAGDLGIGEAMGVLEVGAAADLRDLGVACGDPAAIMYKGRAAAKLAPAQADLGGRRAEDLVTCPYEDLDDPGRVHIGPDGEVQVCQGISAGNCFSRPLEEIVAGYAPRERQVVGALLRGGPWELSRATGLEPQRARYADECHLCYELRSRLRDRFPEVLAPGQCYGAGLAAEAQSGA